MPTLKQKRALEIMTQDIANGETPSYGSVMRRAGFSEMTSRIPGKLTKSKGWNELLAEIDDNAILNKIRSIALDESDKRACLSAADMIFKLKDRYPAGKLKVQAYNEELDRLQELKE